MLLREDGTRCRLDGDRVAVDDDGSNAADVVRNLLDAATRRWPDDIAGISGVGVGATGLASLVERPAALAELVARTVSAPAAVAVDAVTAHLGALGGQGGACVALGTGAIAIGHDGTVDGRWRRVDGWGHLLGDRGSGAWLGRRGLEEALLAYDGVDLGGSRLLAAASDHFGDPRRWPGQIYTRPDRAGLLAGFARDVVELAVDGDAVAVELVTEAGREAARSVVAALGDGTGQVALTGGLRQAGGLLLDAFAGHVAHLRPGAVVVDPWGDALDGAVQLGSRCADGTVVAQEGFVWN